MDGSSKTDGASATRYRRTFVWATEALIALLGIIAIVGPEPAEAAVTRVLGLLLMLAAFLALLVGLIGPPTAARNNPPVAWAVIAFATGALVQWLPSHGLLSLGALTGLLLVGHGAVAALVAVGHSRSSRLWGVGIGLLAILLLLGGLAFLFGEDAGDRIDEMIIGLDIVLFGAYLIAGRLLIERAARSR